MKLRPHHVLDIVSAIGHGAEFRPHPYGHAVHTVAEAICTHPGEDREKRLKGLQLGLAKLGIGSDQPR